MATVHVRVKTIEDKIAEYVDSHWLDIYINYDDSLTKEQMAMLLKGEKDDVIYEVENWANDNHYDGEFDTFWKECREATGASQDDIDDWLSFEGYYPSYSLDEHGFNQLVSNSRPYITAQINDTEWNFNNWAYGHPLEYNDVKLALKYMGINPKEFRDLATGGSMTAGEGKVKGYFPNMPDRVPVVDIKDLYENMCSLYDGSMALCLADLDEVADIMSADNKDKNVVFKKGTNIVMYNFWSGAGITEVELIADMVIPKKAVEFRLDTDYTYGIQDCYGFTYEYWSAGSVGSK